MYRYSARLSWTDPLNPFSRLLAEQHAAGRPLLDLTVSNPTAALADYPHAEISAAFAAVHNFTYQPDAFGRLSVRQAIADRMQARIPSLNLAPEHVALTASTSEAYALLFKLLADPGHQILVPAPSYPLFDFLGALEGIQLRPYRLQYDGSWYIDFASLEAAITSHTRAIILVNPNNPTGSFLKWNEFARLRDIALSHGLPLISDEVFMDYAFQQSSNHVATLACQSDLLSFSLNGLSKSAAMPQMKLGWIMVGGPAAERSQACARLELLLDTYLSVGAPVQLAAAELFAIGDRIQARVRRRLETNLSTLGKLLAESSIHMLHCEGGWSEVLRVPNLLSEEEWITRLLLEHGVIVQPGYFFDMPHSASLVVSLLTEEQTFHTGIERLLALSKQI